MGQLTLFDCTGRITLFFADRPANKPEKSWVEEKNCVLIGGHRGRHKDNEGRRWGRKKSDDCLKDIGFPGFEWEF